MVSRTAVSGPDGILEGRSLNQATGLALFVDGATRSLLVGTESGTGFELPSPFTEITRIDMRVGPGGSVSFESTAGQGSVFRLEFPRDRLPKPREADEPAGGDREKTEKREKQHGTA